LSEEEVDALRTGSLLHDIGKLAVPDHILNKPGRLTPAEIEKTKTHASVGASILEKVGFPNPVVPTVKYHHESWDGSGYPEGLQGNKIPITARILSVADAYDTLRGTRPYRPAVSRDEACRFLRAGAGTQFDPAVVDIFLRNLVTFEREIDLHGLSYAAEQNALGRPLADREAAAKGSYVEQIKRANREVFTLYSLAREFSSAMNLQETLQLFTDKVAEIVPFDTAAIFLINGNGESATAVHAVGGSKSALDGRLIKAGDGATGYVIKKGLPLQNADPSLDFANAESATSFRSMASIPLMVDEKLLGAVSLYSREVDQYQDEHLRLLETVSRIAADAISKSLQHAAAENYALTDSMTGLPNARGLQIHFEKEAKRASRSGVSFQLLVLDLDGFKAVNDTYGHKVGDRMLKEISGVIRGQLRDYDILARYGGDLSSQRPDSVATEFVWETQETETVELCELSDMVEETEVFDGLIVEIDESHIISSAAVN
ncbi:MAG: diguanylate cyclase, partial [Acidobacteria bacterium]|nr:diguanylate cyclase [Acidobacteriota bacterium]